MLTHLHASPTPPTRVVILGARGFIARALAAKLAGDGTKVLAISSQDIDLTLPSAGSALAACLLPTDTVVMVAALTPDKGRNTATLIQNLQMADSVAEALSAQPCAQLVYLSSDAVYDSGDAKIDESTPAAPRDLYGVMHLAREIALTQATSALGIPLCVLRPCAVYGAGDTHNSYGPNRFIRSALNEAKIRLFGTGEETRDHVYIDDVIGIITQVIGRRSTGTINAVSGDPVTFAQLAAEINRQLNGKVTIESLPRNGAVLHRCFDRTSLRHAFPNLTSVPLATGLAQIISNLRQRL